VKKASNNWGDWLRKKREGYIRKCKGEELEEKKKGRAG